MSLDFDRSSWKRVSLRDVIRHVTDRVDAETSGLERFLAGEHIPSASLAITSWGIIGRDPIGPMFYKRFKPGHVLYVSRRTYLRKVAVPEFEGITGEKTFVLETNDPSALLQEFLPFVLSAERFHAYAVANSRGSVNPYLNWGELAEYEFALPPVDDQKRIADLLWTIEGSARANAALLEGGTAARDTWLESVLSQGVVKRKWKQQAVPGLVRSGPTNGKSVTANDEQRGVPTLSISAIRRGRVLGGKAVKYIDVSPRDVAGFVIESDDFLVVRGNGNKHLTGLGGLADAELPEGCVFPDLMMRLRFDASVILPKFAAVQWNSRIPHGALIQKAKSSNGIWKINGQDIKSHRLTVPPLEDQVRIVHELNVFDSAVEAAAVEASRLKTLRAAILADIFGGA